MFVTRRPKQIASGSSFGFRKFATGNSKSAFGPSAQLQLHGLKKQFSSNYLSPFKQLIPLCSAVAHFFPKKNPCWQNMLKNNITKPRVVVRKKICPRKKVLFDVTNSFSLASDLSRKLSVGRSVGWSGSKNMRSNQSWMSRVSMRSLNRGVAIDG